MDLFIIGAGGLGREMAWLSESLGWKVAGFADARPGQRGKTDHQILSDEELLSRRASFAAVVGLGTPVARRAVSDLYSQREDITFPSLVHSSSTLLGPCDLERGVCITAGCRLTGAIYIEEFVLLNLNVTVGHDAVIGSGTIVNPGANISGGVAIGKSVLIGTGATILENLVIGDHATVGAGAVVTRDVPPGSTVAGVPARPMR